MSAAKVRAADRIAAQGRPAYTEARGRAWEIWIKVAPAGPRRRLKTWIPVKRDSSGALIGGNDAAKIYAALEQLWINIEPRWELLHALYKGQFKVYDVYQTLAQHGLRGVDALLLSHRDSTRSAQTPEQIVVAGNGSRTASNGEMDLIQLVELWETSPLDKQGRSGTIKAATRRQMVSHVLSFISPALVAVRNSEALAHRDSKDPAPRPQLEPFAWEDFTPAKFEEHLKRKYRATPTDKQLKDLKNSQPRIREAEENALRGQGDGAFAAFNSMRVFTRWLAAKHGIQSDPTLGLSRPRPGNPSIVALDNFADIEQIAEGLTAPYDDIWRLMCGTGLEPGVALSLKRAHVQIKSGEIIGLGTKNTSRRRRVESGPGAFNALKRAMEQAAADGRETLWPPVDARERQLSVRNMAREVSSRRKQLLAEGHDQFEGVIPYTGRHTFCVMALAGGATPHEIAFQLGHKDASMVIRVYSLHIPKPGRIRAALAGL